MKNQENISNLGLVSKTSFTDLHYIIDEEKKKMEG